MLDIMNLKKLIVEEYRKEKAKGTKIPKFAKKLCNEIEEELASNVEPIKPFIYVNEKKGAVVYVNENKKKFTATCMKGDKFDLYTGASFALGYAHYGDRFKYHENLGVSEGDNLNIASLANAYARFGGKESFEKYVDEINVTKPKAKEEKTEEKPKEEKTE